MHQSHEIIEKSALQKDSQGREHLYVFAPVLVPQCVDLQNQWANAETIKEAAHCFMEKFQESGYRHKAILSKSAITIVENFISKSAMSFGGKEFPAGTWFMGCKVFAKELIDQIQSGQLKGFSIGGNGDLHPKLPQ